MVMGLVGFFIGVTSVHFQESQTVSVEIGLRDK